MSGRGTARTRAMVLTGIAVALSVMALVFQTLAGPPDVAETLLPLAFAGFGGVVAARVPRNRLGWLFLAIALLMSGGQAGDSFMYVARDRWESLPLAQAAVLATGWMWFPTVTILATFCLLLFPDGRLPSRRWRPIAWLAGAGIGLGTATMFAFAFLEIDTLVLDPTGETTGPPVVEGLLMVAAGAVAIAILASIASLFIRWRRSTGVARQQLKWFAFGGLVQLLGIAANFADHPVGTFVSEVSTLALPAAAAIAITRYHLYDIDRIISRTLAWGVVTVVVAGVYLAAVTVLTQWLAPVAGRSPMAVAAATLLAAAAFGPARRRIQTGVDRRFNRSHYDADQIALRYRSRLRHEVDLDSVHSELVATVRATVQPTSVALWLPRTRQGAP